MIFSKHSFAKTRGLICNSLRANMSSVGRLFDIMISYVWYRTVLRSRAVSARFYPYHAMRTELILVRMKFKMVHQYSSVLTIVRVGPCRMGISPARVCVWGGWTLLFLGGRDIFYRKIYVEMNSLKFGRDWFCWENYTSEASKNKTHLSVS
jgi:hypothetical protein